MAVMTTEKPLVEILQSLNTDSDTGLTGSEANERLKKFGPNRLVEERTVTFPKIFWEEAREPMILLLLVVAVFYSIWGELRDFLTIVFVVSALITAEVYNEFRAKRAISALKKLSAPSAPVIRDGRYQEIPTAELVQGDILLLKVGERVQGDARLVESFGLEVDESTLTGESVPVPKDARAVLPEKAFLAERTNTVFAGTVVTRGKGKAVIVATGMETELGRVTGLTREAKEPKTPLQKSMKELAGWLVWVAISVSVLIPLIGFLEGRPFKLMVLTGLGLAFATVPEELPIIITMVLGLGAFQLSRHHALIKRLKTAETLGSVTIIATDKTGTLTENQMVLSRLYANGKLTEFKKGPLTPAASKLLEMGALANDVVTKKEDAEVQYIGDPMEIALVRAFAESGQKLEEVSSRFRLKNEFSFEGERKVMSAVFETDGIYHVFVKGAPEAVLSRSTRFLLDSGESELTSEKRKETLRRIDQMARDGLRVLAFAYKEVSSIEPLSQEEAENGLKFVGVAGFLDPPRKEAPEAVNVCRQAGIRILMITGDHTLTAKAIAKAVGIDADSRIVVGEELGNMDDEELKETVKEVSIFARTTPEHKLRIVRAIKRSGEIVAVTGDGINDAPALREADIGVAMGETGTDVAREASDMILTDDNFATVTFAVREGRKLYDNLRKGVRYYLAVKVGLISIFLLSIILRIPLPFAPIQIIVLELFMDLAASATFVAEPEEGELMTRPPRNPKQRFMDRPMLGGIISGALGLFLAVSAVYLITFYSVENHLVAQTAAFATWMFGHIFLAFNMRSDKEPLLSLGLRSNKTMVVWALGAIGLLVLATNIPLLHASLKLTYLNGNQWLFLIGIAFLATFWMEARKLISQMQSWERS
jgi:Ca2+-transporting ATPase